MLRTFTAIAALCASPAVANNCVPFDQFDTFLSEVHHERPVMRALTHNGAMVMIYAAQDGETWTAVAVGPDGRTCLLASGSAFDAIQYAGGTEG